VDSGRDRDDVCVRKGTLAEFLLLREEDDAVASAVMTNEFLEGAIACEVEVEIALASLSEAGTGASSDFFSSSVVDSCTLMPMTTSFCAMSDNACSDRIRGSVRENTLPTAFEMVFRRPTIVCFCVT